MCRPPTIGNASSVTTAKSRRPVRTSRLAVHGRSPVAAPSPRFAKLVGWENVMAGADHGFSSQALYRREVHNTVVWEKFKAIRQGRRHRDRDALELTARRANPGYPAGRVNRDGGNGRR